MKALAVLEADATAIMESGITATLVAFLQTAVLRMIPYSIPVLPLIAIDMYWGIVAAKHRGEKIRPSTAISRTVAKIFKYICWIIIATTLSIGFQKSWIEWGILFLVFGNELVSIIGNYLETKGIEFSFVGFYRWVLRVITGKVGDAMDAADTEEVIKPKPKPARDSKGRFIKHK